MLSINVIKPFLKYFVLIVGTVRYTCSARQFMEWDPPSIDQLMSRSKLNWFMVR